MTYQHAIDNMQSSASKVEQYRRQSTSGRRSTSPPMTRRWPYARSRSAMDVHQSYVDAARVSQERLGANDAALADLVTTLNRSIQVALGGRGDTVGPAERQGMADEINGLIEHAVVGNTTYRGAYIFSGFAINTEPYAFNGTAITSNVANTAGSINNLIEPGHSIQVNVDGNAVVRPTLDALLQARRAERQRHDGRRHRHGELAGRCDDGQRRTHDERRARGNSRSIAWTSSHFRSSRFCRRPRMSTWQKR